jgi:hypothetical protein
MGTVAAERYPVLELLHLRAQGKVRKEFDTTLPSGAFPL